MSRKPAPIYDEEINYDEGVKFNFGKYVETLVRQWQWIAACLLGVGIVGLTVYILYDHFFPSYEADVLVATTTTVSNVNFGSAITSASDVQLAAQAAYGSSAFYNYETRVSSFVSQVQSGTIAEQIFEKFGPILNSNSKGNPITITDLLDMVSGDLLPKTDTIQILVKYKDPVIAAEIANAWGQAYVQQINESYSLSGPTYTATEMQVNQAKTDYTKAEAVLQDFIAHDRSDEYKRKIDEISKIITLLQGSRTSIGEEQVGDHLKQLAQAYQDSREIGLFLDNAISMRAAVSAGGEPAAISNALALTMLKTQIYAAYQGTNTLQVQNLPEALGSNISTVNAAGMVADLDALISTLKTRHAELDQQIDTLSSEVQNENYLMNYSTGNTPIENKIQEDEQQIRDMNSLREVQASTLNELTQTRDLAWKSYSALETKATEISVNALNTQVVFASSAIPPQSSGISLKIVGVISVGIGLLIGIIVAYAYEFWQNYKGRQPESIVKNLLVYVKKVVPRKPLNSQKA